MVPLTLWKARQICWAPAVIRAPAIAWDVFNLWNRSGNSAVGLSFQRERTLPLHMVFALVFMSSFSRCALILDLDFTLLHLEWLPGSLEVPGRTRSAWIAPRTIELLRRLQNHFALVLATARSWDGTRWVCEGFAQKKVEVAGLVLEDGALWGQPAQLQALEPSFSVEGWKKLLEAHKSQWPGFEWQLDFRACLVARCETGDEALKLCAIFEGVVAGSDEARVFRDGRKVYVLPRRADKWSALQKLLGEGASLAAGAGDGANDLAWLPHVAYPATFAGANPQLASAVEARGGFVSQLDGHAGIADILQKLTPDEHG